MDPGIIEGNNQSFACGQVASFSQINHAIEECWNGSGTLVKVTDTGSMNDSDWPGRFA